MDALTDNEVHVWSAGLDVGPDRLSQLSGLLSSDERERAGRFHFRRDRDRFVAGRGRLRELLGHYVERAPRLLRFSYTPFGKPLLEGPATIFFNVSHSGDRALFAFSRGSDVGVDIELLRPEAVDGRVAERFFAPAEVEALRSLPPEQQLLGFLTCWTRKEAFIKAKGDGLSLPLHDFDVTLKPGELPRLLRTAWKPEEAEEWELRDLSEVSRGTVAALAFRSGRDIAVSTYGA